MQVITAHKWLIELDSPIVKEPPFHLTESEVDSLLDVDTVSMVMWHSETLNPRT